ncbi:MAG: fused MFS/spermidine synthase [Proteobacteria bacterium]|nr:fused MFS/spermidine synthase [Pseudomonadota bacterium]
MEKGKIKQGVFILMAFCAGASVMIVELAANRILAPWFGNSLFTWTGLIGVILISMSLGSYLGGKIIDKFPTYSVLKIILLVSGIIVMMIPGLQSQISGFYEDPDLIWGPVSACLILFSVPGILLGSITPIVIRLISLMSDDLRVGVSAGSISAASTLGSVVGTFATGFILIPNVGIRNIYFTTGAVLICLSFILIIMNYFESRKIKKKEVAAVITLVLVSLLLSDIIFHKQKTANLIFEEDTFYHRINIFSYPFDNGIDTVIALNLDTQLEGAQLLKSNELPIPYQKYWELVKVFTTNVDNALFIGGGAFGMPIALSEDYKRANIDVVELDPKVIEVGKKYFRINAHDRLHPIADDARRFLNSTKKKYDLVIGDAYHGLRYIPPHLVTKEFFSLVNQSLTDDGIFMINIISSIKSESGVFHSIINTLNLVFKSTYVFTSTPDFLYGPMNIVIVASNKDIDFKKRALSMLSNDRLQKLVSTYIPSDIYKPDLADGKLLTDDYNPIEYLITKSLIYNY